MRLFSILVSLVLGHAALAQELPEPAAQFDVVTVRSVDPVYDSNTGKLYPEGGHIVTFDTEVPNGDGVLIFIRDGKTVKYQLDQLYFEPAKPGMPLPKPKPTVAEGKPTRRLHCSYEACAISNVRGLFFSKVWSPVSK